MCVELYESRSQLYKCEAGTARYPVGLVGSFNLKITGAVLIFRRAEDSMKGFDHGGTDSICPFERP